MVEEYCIQCGHENHLHGKFVAQEHGCASCRINELTQALGDEVRKKADVQSENTKLREVLSTVKTYGHLLPSLIRDDVEEALSPKPAQCPHCGVPLTGMNSNPDECLRRPSDTVPTSTCIGTPVITVSKGAPAGVAAPPWAQDIKADIKADTLLGVYSGGDVSSVYVNWFRWQRLADWLNEEWRTKRALPTVCEDCRMPMPHAATSSCIRNMVEAKPSPDSLELEIARHTVRSVDAIYDVQEG